MKSPTSGLIKVMNRALITSEIQVGLERKFQWVWDWKVFEKGGDFVAQFLDVSKIEILEGFVEFKLKGTDAYVKIVKDVTKVVPKG